MTTSAFGTPESLVRRPERAGWLALLNGETAQPTPLAESLDSHRLAFAGEQASRGSTVQTLGGKTLNDHSRA